PARPPGQARGVAAVVAGPAGRVRPGRHRPGSRYGPDPPGSGIPQDRGLRTEAPGQRRSGSCSVGGLTEGMAGAERERSAGVAPPNGSPGLHLRSAPATRPTEVDTLRRLIFVRA